ncbi:hypothetical protein [Legionella spiritensis]|uniref:Uncharacterized protein n=1 Tax=Legionella spiritensis TaxID=452 RepID=A0A0W0YXD3_LEGSP|nr:hypothetical protein [Legionella spiritensis]KTD61573.1 hypothetical protein Lspi_2203 [Legionella spiritensis]SNV32397.1 Uncharacterised protein [Legionella spiritensis]
MEASSVGLILRLLNWLLNKLGYKIVPINNSIIEEVPVQLKWADEDSDIQKERQDGATFRWADVRHSGYEYYEVIKGNIKERYKSGGQYLWIKKASSQGQK